MVGKFRQMTEDSESVEIRRWIKRGIMRVNSDALHWDDPDHTYNQILSQGKRPEDFGIEHPISEEFKDKSRGELIAEIIDLRKELESFYIR